MISYQKIGSGPEKVFVLHGWKMDQSCFDQLHPALDTEQFSYIFIDQRGYGLSKQEPGPFTVVQVASDIIGLADALAIEQFHFIGHSMAGKVLSRLIADIPRRIKSAVGITPCPPAEIPFDSEGWQLFSSAASDTVCRKQIFALSTGNRLTETWYQAITRQSMESSSAEAFADYLESWVHYQCFEDILGSTVPVKIIAGEHDPHLSLEVMQQTFGQWLPQAEIIQMQNCGHYPMYETPLALAAECENFIRKNL